MTNWILGATKFRCFRFQLKRQNQDISGDSLTNKQTRCFSLLQTQIKETESRDFRSRFDKQIFRPTRYSLVFTVLFVFVLQTTELHEYKIPLRFLTTVLPVKILNKQYIYCTVVYILFIYIFSWDSMYSKMMF